MIIESRMEEKLEEENCTNKQITWTLEPKEIESFSLCQCYVIIMFQ